MKLTVSKSKNSASFYVQKSIRKPNGSVTTVTVEKLGNLDEVRTKAGGMDPYVWAQEYVNELNRREYEEQKEIIISCSPSKLLKMDEKKILQLRISLPTEGLLQSGVRQDLQNHQLQASF